MLLLSNALPEWIDMSVSVLPKTKQFLIQVEVISARARYQKYYTDMSEWKKKTFLDEIIKRSNTHKYNNILSLGDAEFEYIALINLYDIKIIPNKYLKSIKFIKAADYETLLEQIKMIRRYIGYICKLPRHVDMIFATQEATFAQTQ